MKATIYFANDPSVGMFPEYFEMDLPRDQFEDDADREFCRDQIKKTYNELNSDTLVSWVSFSDEKQD